MTAINDADFTRTCNNLLYPPRREPLSERKPRTPDDVRAEAYAIEAMLKEAETKTIRRAERRFGKALRAGLAEEITVEQFQAELRRYLRITGQEDFGS